MGYLWFSDGGERCVPVTRYPLLHSAQHVVHTARVGPQFETVFAVPPALVLARRARPDLLKVRHDVVAPGRKKLKLISGILLRFWDDKVTEYRLSKNSFQESSRKRTFVFRSSCSIITHVHNRTWPHNQSVGSFILHPKHYICHFCTCTCNCCTVTYFLNFIIFAIATKHCLKKPHAYRRFLMRIISALYG